MLAPPRSDRLCRRRQGGRSGAVAWHQ